MINDTTPYNRYYSPKTMFLAFLSSLFWYFIVNVSKITASSLVKYIPQSCIWKNLQNLGKEHFKQLDWLTKNMIAWVFYSLKWVITTYSKLDLKFL